MKTIVISSSLVRRPQKKKRNFGKLILIALGLALISLYAINFRSINNILNFHQLKVKYGTYGVMFENGFPDDLKGDITTSLDKVMLNDKHRFKVVTEKEDIEIQTKKTESNTEILSEILIPVGHRYSLLDSITLATLKDYHIYVLDDGVKAMLNAQYDIDAQKVDSEDSLMKVLENSDKNIALVKFEELSYKMKILYLDGKYYLDDTSGGVPINVYASVKNNQDTFIFDVLKINLKDLTKVLAQTDIFKLNMTGVTAISRDLGSKMNTLKDYVYPAEKIGSFLADADLTHTSNEVSFTNSCVVAGGMRFCAKPEYIQAIQASGIDIVELTGNHNNDYGSTANANTINTYISLGMKYFGGGLNSEDAAKILYEDVDGTTVAFIGYNYYDTMLKTGAIAWDDTAGANSYSEEKLAENIKEAKANADVVIVDFQFQECYCYPDTDVIYPICYKPLSNPDQKGVFRKAIDLGANIVVGTQAHQPQTYELYGDGIIFYGLGNLYFDQNIWIGTRQGMVLTHYFYQGKYIQTKITATMMDMNLQTRIATQAEGDQLMKLLKTARN